MDGTIDLSPQHQSEGGKGEIDTSVFSSSFEALNRGEESHSNDYTPNKKMRTDDVSNELEEHELESSSLHITNSHPTLSVDREDASHSFEDRKDDENDDPLGASEALPALDSLVAPGWRLPSLAGLGAPGDPLPAEMPAGFLGNAEISEPPGGWGDSSGLSPPRTGAGPATSPNEQVTFVPVTQAQSKSLLTESTAFERGATSPTTEGDGMSNLLTQGFRPIDPDEVVELTDDEQNTEIRGSAQHKSNTTSRSAEHSIDAAFQHALEIPKPEEIRNSGLEQDSTPSTNNYAQERGPIMFTMNSRSKNVSRNLHIQPRQAQATSMPIPMQSNTQTPHPALTSQPPTFFPPGVGPLHPLFIRRLVQPPLNMIPSFFSVGQTQYPATMPGGFGGNMAQCAPGVQSFPHGCMIGPVPAQASSTKSVIVTSPPMNGPTRVHQKGIPLALSCDAEQLSDYQILVREQLELFEASSEDVRSNTQGRKKQVTTGQVGLRCKHCSPYPLRQRGKGAVYYPAKLRGIYQAAQNMACGHLCDACQHIPVSIKHQLQTLRKRKDSASASAGKTYWAEGCQAIGLYETENDGLKLRRRTSSSTEHSEHPLQNSGA